MCRNNIKIISKSVHIFMCQSKCGSEIIENKSFKYIAFRHKII